MSLEAVPVCLKGSNETVYGIIIRPTTSAQQVNTGAQQGTPTLVPASTVQLAQTATTGVTTSAIQLVPSQNPAIVNASVQCSSGPSVALRAATPSVAPIASKSMTILSTAQASQASTSGVATLPSTSVIPIAPKISSTTSSAPQLAAYPAQILQIPSWAAPSSSTSSTQPQLMVQYSMPPVMLSTGSVSVQSSQLAASTQQDAPSKRGGARKRHSANEKNASSSSSYATVASQKATQRSPIASADLQNTHCKMGSAGGVFDSPSPSQVVPQMNVDSYDPLNSASTPSSCSYLPPISTLAPSSAGSSTQQLSPPLHDASLTSTHQDYSPQTSDLQQQYAHQHPSTSAHGFMTDALGEDLNCIDYTQLLSNSATITTEEYLPNQQQPQHAAYAQSTAHDGSQHHYGHPSMAQHAAVGYGAPVVHQNVQRVRQNFGQEMPYPHQPVMMPKTSACYTGYPQGWPVQAYGNQAALGPHHQMSSSTPDSGIQSIDGSPPSVSSYTPPMVSPYMAQAPGNECRAPSTPATACNEVSSTTPEDDENDFSDMPTLIPEGSMPQMAAAEQCNSEAPNLLVSSTSKPMGTPSSAKKDRRERSRSTASRPSTANDSRSAMLDAQSPDVPSSSTFDIGSPPVVLPASCCSDTSIPSVGTPSSGTAMVAITPTMDPAEILKNLESTLGPEKLKEIRSLLQDKAVVVEDVAMTGTAAASVANADQCASIKPAESAVSSDATADEEEPPSPIAKKPRKRETPSNDDVEQQRILEYQRQVKAKLRERMQVVINELEGRFKGMQLDLGRCIKLPLPWQHVNWKAVEERMASRAAERRKLTKRSRRQQPQAEDRRKRRSGENSSADRHRTKRGKTESDTRSRGRRKDKTKHSATMDIYEASPSPSTSSLKITLIRRLSQDGEEVVGKRSRSREHTAGYERIEKNDFVDAPPAIPAAPACKCDASRPCTENSLCTRRMGNAECTEKSCAVGAELCRNRRISNKEAIPSGSLQTFTTSRGDKGVCSKEDLKRGQFICEYVGEVVRLKTYKRRTASGEAHQPRYGMHLLSSHVVDATQKGNISRFFNHSCQPNCEMQRWLVNGQYRLAIFASEDIPAGQELTYDYSAFHASVESKQACQCGEVGCLGTIPTISYKHGDRRPRRMYQRELKLVRDRHTFLPRNLKLKPSASMLRPIPSCPELSAILIKLVHDLATFCRQKERISRKRITQMQIAVRKTLRTCSSPDTSSATVVERFDVAMKSYLHVLSRSLDRRRADAIRSHYMQLKRATDLQKAGVPKEAVQSFVDEKRRPALQTKRENPKAPAGEADLSYMDSEHPVGSYNPDTESKLSLGNSEVECVRCVCGIMEDDGLMMQCERCNSWLHSDCINFTANSEDESYLCDFCIKGYESTPAVDIVLQPQPKVTLKDCTYYKTLVNNRGIQVRLSEAVYVERLINDKHKRILKKLHEKCVKQSSTPSKRCEKSRSITPKMATPTKQPQEPLVGNDHTMDDEEDDNDLLSAANITQKEFDRKDLRIFRVERLFKGPNGERFVFGCYYARPHETFCEPSRQFYRNEIFWTPLFDTLPLDAVVGRCLILEPNIWAKGRPKSPKYLEEDVFICEYQIGKNQRCFEKIKKENKYPVNTAEYVFEEFGNPLVPKRDFSPFVASSPPKAEVKPQSSKQDQTAAIAKQITTERMDSICERLKARATKMSQQSNRRRP